MRACQHISCTCLKHMLFSMARLLEGKRNNDAQEKSPLVDASLGHAFEGGGEIFSRDWDGDGGGR